MNLFLKHYIAPKYVFVQQHTIDSNEWSNFSNSPAIDIFYLRLQFIYIYLQFPKLINTLHQTKILIYFLFLQNSSYLMGNCSCKSKSKSEPNNSKRQDTLQYYSQSQSVIRINVKRKTGIFQDSNCPINSQIIQEIDKLLQQKDLNDCFLGLHGQHDPVWKKINYSHKMSQWWYVGEWKNGKMFGYGNLYNHNQQFLIKGIFLDGILCRKKCIKIFSNGSYYIGSLNEFLDPQGHGELHYKDDICKYIGAFEGGVPHGSGKQIYQQGEFIGKFNYGEKKEGKLIQDEGMYEGQFENNKKQGKGKFMWKNGKIFEGHFKNNKMIEGNTNKQRKNKVSFDLI